MYADPSEVPPGLVAELDQQEADVSTWVQEALRAAVRHIRQAHDGDTSVCHAYCSSQELFANVEALDVNETHTVLLTLLNMVAKALMKA